MTMGKYCRVCGVDILSISKKSNIQMVDLNTIYQKSLADFEKIINKWRNK